MDPLYFMETGREVYVIFTRGGRHHRLFSRFGKTDFSGLDRLGSITAYIQIQAWSCDILGERFPRCALPDFWPVAESGEYRRIVLRAMYKAH